jgi:3-isopropylmalate/(R)-2-methylmalate dehydratase small subunit
MEKFTVVSGIAAWLPMANVTTDAMSPTLAGKSTSVHLGKLLFALWRYDLEGQENPDFVLNKPPFRESSFLIAGANFGCGSSRERAVWSLQKFGIRAVIAPSFADIFRDNSFQNGLLPVELPEANCNAIAALLATAKEPVLTVDLERQTVTAPNGESWTFEISKERRMALLEGLEEMDVILRMEPDIDQFEARDRSARPWIYLDR